jgi:hypothetical protein
MAGMCSEVTRKPCAFVIRINRPLLTGRKILDLLIDRNIKVENMVLHGTNETEALLIINCIIERDRVRHTLHQLEKVPGIIQIELLESKLSHLWK